VDTGRVLENEKGTSYDVYSYFAVPDTVRVQFGLSNDEDIQKYSSSRKRLKYRFCIPCPVLPTVKLNSFSFTREKDGDTIPCVLYYRTKGRVVNIIDSLPVIFTDSIEKGKKMVVFEIFAECSQSYAATKTVYINYDIEVGSECFVKQIKYTKKRYWDWRPKFR